MREPDTRHAGVSCIAAGGPASVKSVFMVGDVCTSPTRLGPKTEGDGMTISLTIDSTDYASSDYDDVGFYIDHQRGAPSRMVAVAIENARGPLLAWLAGHVGEQATVDVTSRGMRVEGTVTVSGASRLEFSADDQPTTGPGA